VVWADFLDNNRVISLSEAGELAVWSVPELKPLYQAQLPSRSRAAISRGRKFVAIAKQDGILLLHAASGKFAGFLEGDRASESAALDFSLDGRRLALLNSRSRLRVWDLETKKLEREFAVNFHRDSFVDKRQMAWVAPGYLLTGNQLIDVERYVTIPAYHPLISWTEYQGQVWLLDAVIGSPVVYSENIPAKQLRDKWAKLPADAYLVIKPGLEVAVAIQTTDPHTAAVRDAIVKSLTERGINVVADSPIKLIGTIGAAPPEAVTYNSAGAFGAQNTSVTIQGNMATLMYQVNGEVVWTYMTKTGAPLFVRSKKGESIAQAAQAQATLDSRVFQNAWIPVYVARGVKDPSNPEASPAMDPKK
jgi:hypothetical protein